MSAKRKFVKLISMRRLSLALLTIGLISLIVSSQASAQLAPHPTFDKNGRLWGVAQSGSNILVVSGGAYGKSDADDTMTARLLYLSNDNGKTFRSINYGLYVWGATTGPDGNFYLAGDNDKVSYRGAIDGVVNYPDIWRVNANTGALTAMNSNLPRARGQVSAPAFDGQGNAWVVTSRYNGELTRLSTSNWQVQETIPLRQTETLDTAMASQQQGLDLAAGSLFISSESSISSVEYMRYKDGQLSKFSSSADHGMPQWVSGDKIIFTHGISYNGGRTIASNNWLYGNPNNGGNYLILTNRLFRKTSDNYFQHEGLRGGSDEQFNSVLEVPGGQLTFYDFSNLNHSQYSDGWLHSLYAGTDIFTNQEKAPGLKQVGNLEPDTQEMISQANLLRAEAGFPPLIGDSEISKASRNHVAYQMKHFEGHKETPGKEGFTGENSWDRCLFVGTSCGGEILSQGSFGKWAVNAWMTTSFHRDMIGHPAAGFVGGAYKKGEKFWNDVSVMNSGSGQGILTGPAPFPIGTWRGELGFYNESPDPGARCKGVPNTISKPYGTAVSLYLPGSMQISNITVSEAGSGQALRGCIIEQAFIPDDELKPFTRYNVRAYYNEGAGGSNQLIEWSFTTTGANSGDDDGRSGGGGNSGGNNDGGSKDIPDNCQAQVRLTGKSSRKIKQGLTFKYQGCSDETYLRFTLTRVKSKKASIKLNEYLGVAKGDGSINLSRKVRRGKYKASISLYNDGGTIDRHRKTLRLR